MDGREVGYAKYGLDVFDIHHCVSKMGDRAVDIVARLFDSSPYLLPGAPYGRNLVDIVLHNLKLNRTLGTANSTTQHPIRALVVIIKCQDNLNKSTSLLELYLVRDF